MFADIRTQGCDIKIYYNKFTVMLEITDYKSAQKHQELLNKGIGLYKILIQ